MFEKLKQQLRMLTVAPVPFDPARFGDPLALQHEGRSCSDCEMRDRVHMFASIGLFRRSR
jgi:hypothetical protein